MPDAGAIPPWAAALEPLTERLKDECGDNWGWTQGGCFAFAEAFVETYGGEFWAVCSRCVEDGETDFPVEHAIVRVGDAFYDYSGRLDLDAYCSLLHANTGREILVKARTDDGVFWFEDEFLDEDAMDTLKATLAEVRDDREPSAPAMR